jgi:hypothetical protein
MKLSRKVWRRSRKHTSSISRRRLRNKKTKSGYRKKHTQRGGRYGKRGRSYKRVRVRTHKRGRRFHRGGFNCDSLDTINYFGRSRMYYGDTDLITYNKKGFTEFASVFKVCFEIEFMEEPEEPKRIRILIIFTRKSTHGQPESESPTFVFQLVHTSYSDVITSLDSILLSLQTTSHITESDKEYNIRIGRLETNPIVKKPLRMYRFTSEKNTEIFKNIIKCIKKKLNEYYEEKYPGIPFDQNFPAIPSEVDSDSDSSVDSSYVMIDRG